MSWQINGNETKNGVATDNHAEMYEKYYRMTSRLRVNITDWENPNNRFTCIVSFYNGADNTQHEVEMYGVQAKTRLGITRGTFLKVSQNGKLCYGVFIVKSCIYGAFVTFLVWKLQSSAGKKDY